MKYYLISGEASGDLHGAGLIRELKKLDPEGIFRCWGGDLMEKQGAALVKHYKELAFMGFAEVLMNIRRIMKNFSLCKEDILKFQPDVVILIDYPGFNLRMAKFIKDSGIRVFYYISPQVWAWKQNRVYKIKRYVDKMFVILPFEKDFYKKFNYNVDFTGHPLTDAIEDKKKGFRDFETFVKEHGLSGKPVIAVLPGSRKQEIKTKLPIMLSAAKHYPDYEFVIARTSSVEPAFYQQNITGNVKVLTDKTYELIHHAKAAIVKSGTSTLETALIGTPEVVCYKSPTYLSYIIAKQVIKVKYISLVNLIPDKPVVKELIQYDFTEEKLKKELDELLFNETYRIRMKQNFEMLKEHLGGTGASKRAAELMRKYLDT